MHLHKETLGKTHKKVKRPPVGRRCMGWTEVVGGEQRKASQAKGRQREKWGIAGE